MKKILFIIAALTLSMGMWGETIDNVEYVDLGLPSGIKWAACNIGATNPEEYGDYFSWGETEPKDDYSWDKYTYKDNHPDVLPADHDAARLNWGGHWRMPTLDDFEELRKNCKCSYTTNYNNTGVAGCVFTRKDGNSIFFPAAGNHAGNGSNFVGERGYSWLSTLNETNSDEAYGLCFHLKPYEDMGWKVIERYYGLPIRPVYDPSMTPTPISVDYIDENGAEQTADDVNDIAPSDAIVTLGTTAGQTTWYVVIGADVTLSKGAVCHGDVRLILADGAKLTATGVELQAGIQVSGDGNSLTIYGQTAQTGQLIANGSDAAAGIGGNTENDGSNITINGGKIKAVGGNNGAGIGGGNFGNGSNIVINSGTVEAIGYDAAGIGGGLNGEGSDIYISDAYILKLDNTTEAEAISHSSAQDMGETLNAQQYVKIEGLATPYTRSVTDGQWGTVCLPYGATSFEGADFFKVNYYNGSDKLYIEPVTTLEAGMPYIFEATAAGTLTINHSATAPIAYSAVGNEGGLYGSFARKVITSDGNFAAISGGQVVIVENGYTLTVPACRAYLDMNEVPRTVQPHSAPLRVMGVPCSTPTSLYQTRDTKHQTQKLLRNGQFVIIREGKTYNAQGQIIQ